MTITTLPKRSRGRLNGAAEEAYQADLRTFCDRILEIRSRLDFEVGSRGWCYLIEAQGVIAKREFDQAEALISRCRKDGNFDICAEDGKRAANGIETLDEDDVEGEVDKILQYLEAAHLYYTPFSFWDRLEVYIEVAVEKGDLKSLFSRITDEFHVAIQNIGGWADLNSATPRKRRAAVRAPDARKFRPSIQRMWHAHA